MKENNKTYIKAINSPQNLRYSELVKIVEGVGFTLRKPKRKKSGSSHKIYTHPKVKGIVNIQADKKNMAINYQVDQVLGYIEFYNLLEKEEKK
jgi:hypothetical protein